MFGNSIIVNGTNKTDSVKNFLSYKNIICENHMIKKFDKDKIFAETDKYIVLLDGVILNKNILSIERKSWLDTVISLYEEKGERFFTEFRGSFAGAFYDKGEDKWIIYGDQIGSKFIFYAKIGKFFCCSEVMGYMYDLLKANHIKYHLSEENALLLLTCGYMVDDRTLCEEIHKINPGCYIVYQNEVVKEYRYYLLDNSPKAINEDDAIKLIDSKFRSAIKLQFNKDKEYGYSKHLVALSGGLDCRMCSVVAHEMGYKDQVNITFSQTDYWDQTEPMKMARDMNHEWIFKSLDGGNWLYNVDDIVRLTGGNVLYFGSAHEYSLFKYLNYKQFGMLHSGQLGDVVLGSWILAKDKEKKYTIGERGYSSKYLGDIRDLALSLDLDAERGPFYYRGFNGTNNAQQPCYDFTETFSPFYELDFLEAALSIPVELRQNHYIYKKWIINKYPFAANYVWETSWQKITSGSITIKGQEIPFARIPWKISNVLRRKFHMSTERADSKKNMNPVAYYLKTNTELSQYLDSYFAYIDGVPEGRLKSILKEIRETGGHVEKIQATTLLSAIKLFFFDA